MKADLRKFMVNERPSPAQQPRGSQLRNEGMTAQQRREQAGQEALYQPQPVDPSQYDLSTAGGQKGYLSASSAYAGKFQQMLQGVKQRIQQPVKRTRFTDRRTRIAQQQFIKETLPQAERDVSSFQSNIAQKQAELAQAQAEYEATPANAAAWQRTYDLVNRSIKQYGPGVTSGAYVRQLQDLEMQTGQKGLVDTYLSEVKGIGKAAQKAEASLTRIAITDWEKNNPGEKVNIDKSGNIVSVSSAALGRSIPIEQYDQMVKEQVSMGTVPTGDLAVPMSKSYVSRSMLPSVSALQSTPTDYSSFRSIPKEQSKILAKTLVVENYMRALRDTVNKKYSDVKFFLTAPKKPSSTLTIPQEDKVNTIVDYNTGKIRRTLVKQDPITLTFKPKSAWPSLIAGFSPRSLKGDINRFYQEEKRKNKVVQYNKDLTVASALPFGVGRYIPFKDRFAGNVKIKDIKSAVDKGNAPKSLKYLGTYIPETKLQQQGQIVYGTGIGLSLGTGLIAPTTATALAINTPKLNKLIAATETGTPEQRRYALRELALASGGAALGGILTGATFKIGELGAKTAGSYLLARTALGAPSVAKNVIGLGLYGSGKALQLSSDIYFKNLMIGGGFDIATSLKQKRYEQAKMQAAQAAGSFVGFPFGSRLGSTLYKGGLVVTGRYAPTIYEQGTIKTMPSGVQSQILTGKNTVYVYRRGPLEYGGKITPRLDKYLTPSISNPTKQVFFRFAETKGVKGNKIGFVPSVPSFVSGPRYRDMFLANMKDAGVNKNIIARLWYAFKKTPTLTDTVVAAKRDTFNMPKELADRIVYERATTGRLTKKTQSDLKRYANLLSDKLREKPFAEEQEIVFRDMFKLGKTKRIMFTLLPNGKLLPVIAEKGTVKAGFRPNKKNIIEQDAAYIKRQWGLFDQFREKYVEPKGHGGKHLTSVARNVNKLIDEYQEFHPYFIKKYGSLANAKQAMNKAALAHDIGKTSESSNEFGIKHGEKVYQVFKRGLLPEYLQSMGTRAAQAVRIHETVAGTARGRNTLRYRIGDLLRRYTPEDKILATADRLDLLRYGMKVDPKRLPLGDALNRLGVKSKATDKIDTNMESKTKEYNPSNNLVRTSYLPSVSAKSNVAYTAQQTSSNYAYNIGKTNYNPLIVGYNIPYNKYTPTTYRYTKTPEISTPYTPIIPYLTIRYPPRQPPYNPPYTPPRYPPRQPPRPPFQLIWLPKRQGKIDRRRRTVRPTRYNVLPTVFQQIAGIRGRRPIRRRLTGFEAIRLI